MIFPSEILESIASHLWAVSWQVSILIALIWVSSLFGRKSSSNFRYWLWCIVIVRLCIPAGLTLPVSFDLNLKSAVVSHISTMTTEPSEPEKTPPVQSLNTVSAPNPEGLRSIQAPETSATVPPLTITAVIGLLWLAGVLSILTVIIWRVLRLQKRLKTSPVITRPDLREMLERLVGDMGIKRPIHLHYMELERINSPAVSGLINLRIYLPRHIADTWSLEELKPVLLHELAHIRRHDMIVNWLQIVLQVFYFFHPLVWYANREIRRLREEVCDDLAIHHLGFEKNQYSQSILNIVRNMGKQPVFGSIGLGFTERKSLLKERIGRIMSDRYKRYTKMEVSSIAVLVFIGIISVGLASAKLSSDVIDVKTFHSNLDKAHAQIFSLKGKYELRIINSNDSSSQSNTISTPYRISESAIYHYYRDMVYYEEYDKDFKNLKMKVLVRDGVLKSIHFMMDEKSQIRVRGHIREMDNLANVRFQPFRDIFLTLWGLLVICEKGGMDFIITTVDYNNEECFLIEFPGTGIIPQIDGVDPVLLQTYYDPKTTRKVWVGKKNYNPLKYEYYGHNGQLSRLIDIHYQEVQGYDIKDNYYIPKEIITEEYKYHTGELESKKSAQFLGEWEVNRIYPEDTFTLDFPPYLTVDDERINKTYIIVKDERINWDKK